MDHQPHMYPGAHCPLSHAASPGAAQQASFVSWAPAHSPGQPHGTEQFSPPGQSPPTKPRVQSAVSDGAHGVGGGVVVGAASATQLDSAWAPGNVDLPAGQAVH